jgi:CHAD domain-containing protein
MVPDSQQQEAPPPTECAPAGSGASTEFWLPPGDDAAAWGKVRKIALAQAHRMLRVVPKILRADDPRYIHDFRVAGRRCQQALDLLSAPSASAPLSRLRRKVKRSRRALSDVRNCDVLIQSVEARLARHRMGHHQAWNAVLEYLRERRSHAHARALRKLTKSNFGKLYTRLQSILASGVPAAQAKVDADLPATTARATEAPLNLQLSAELEKTWSRFHAEILRSQQSPDGESIHRARIAGKKLRYLIEIMAGLEIPGCRDAIGWLRELQRYLGEWHDRDVAEQIIAEALARPQFIREHLAITAEIVRLIAQERKAKLRLSAKYQEMGLASGGGARLQTWVEALLKPGL